MNTNKKINSKLLNIVLIIIIAIAIIIVFQFLKPTWTPKIKNANSIS